MDSSMTLACKRCGATQTFAFDRVDLFNWSRGQFIQNAMPYLDVGERELLISGTCGACFDAMFMEEASGGA